MRRRLGAALGLLLLGLALAQGALPSGASFVATSSNPLNGFATAPVFNTVTVSLSDPGTPLRGSVALAATAGSDHPLASVRIQRSPAGAGSWTDVCTDTAAPYDCTWATGGAGDGLYDLRAIALDDLGYSRTSAVVADRRVDNTAPATAITDPGSPLTGTRTVSATATDAGGVASVLIERRDSPSGAWTAICTDTGAPYSCAWSTAGVSDGLYDLRATATDGAGNSASSIVGARRVDNTAPTVTVTDDGTPKRATASMTSTAGDGAGTGVASVRYQFRASPSGTWTDACTSTSAPFSCPVDTTAVPDGLYDVRAIATDGVPLSTTSAAITIRVDNTAPSAATMTDPGSPLSGTVTLGGTASDAVGLGSMRFEYKPSAGSTWSTACTDATPPSPFSCAWSTTALADGSYDLRAIATDTAGNTRTSATVASRMVDNNGPVVSVTSPGTVRSSATVNATATDVSGVQSVAIQYRTAGAGGYTTICTDTTSPYSCAWTVLALADGNYDLHAIATDGLGRQTTSAVVGATVNNTGPTGVDVQGANGGVSDRLDAGDSVTFTYGAAMAPASILGGWNGAAATVTVRVFNNGSTDAMQFYDAADATSLGLLAAGTSLAINVDYVTAPTRFRATMVQTVTNIKVTLNALLTGSVTSTPKGTNAMVWRPSKSSTDLTGKALFETTVTESGALDLDF